MALVKVRPITYLCDVEASDRPTESTVPEGSIAVCEDTAKSYIQQDGTWTDITGGGGGITDGDKGDITVSGAGSVWTIDNDAVTSAKIANDAVGTTEIANDSVTYAKIQNVADNRLLGRSAGSSGDVQEITMDSNMQLSGGVLSAVGTSVRRKSWLNPPSSPHAYDDEFDSGSLDSKWSIFGGTPNAATSGTIDYTASLTTAIVDVVTVPGWCMIQLDNTSGNTLGISQNISPGTNATFFTRIGGSKRDFNSTEGSTVMSLQNSGDANEEVYVGYTRSSTAGFFTGAVVNNGVTTSTSSAYSETEGVGQMPICFIIWKKSDVYHFGYSRGESGPFNYIGSVTKTGVTSFDRLKLMRYTANETPSDIDGFDFFRYKASIDYSMINA